MVHYIYKHPYCHPFVTTHHYMSKKIMWSHGNRGNSFIDQFHSSGFITVATHVSTMLPSSTWVVKIKTWLWNIASRSFLRKPQNKGCKGDCGGEITTYFTTKTCYFCGILAFALKNLFGHCPLKSLWIPPGCGTHPKRHVSTNYSRIIIRWKTTVNPVANLKT